MSITALPTPPSRSDPTNFAVRADDFLGALPTFGTEANALATDVNTKQSTASTAATTATTQAGIATTKAGEAAASAAAALQSENDAYGLVELYLGASASDPTTGRLGAALVAGNWYINSSSGFIRAYTGSAWVNGVSSVSGVSSVNGLTGAVVDIATTNTAQNLTNKTLTEVVYVITDGASVDLNPINGSIQTWTLGASRTATASSFVAGQSLILGVDDGSTFSLTWPAIVWSKVGGGGTAPTLTATGRTWVVLWKVNSTLYGSLLGSA